jgi:hypothetical protein
MSADTTEHLGHLIAAKQIQGTTVYNTALEELGFVHDLLINYGSGRLAYAVVKFGGHFHMGRHCRSLPWEKFSYNNELGGYIIDIDRDTLHARHVRRVRRDIGGLQAMGGDRS